MNTKIRKSYSNKQKLDILKELDSGKSRKDVMKDHGISRSSLGDLVKKKEELLSEVLKNPKFLSRKKKNNVKDYR
jgi:transposase-like protein